MKKCKVKELVADSREGKWWEKIKEKKSGQLWKTLKHNGVYFPESYEKLPDNVQILYKGISISLNSKNVQNRFNISEEEAAVFFSQMVDRDERLKNNQKRHRYSEDQIFRQNFWNDWKIILGSNHVVKSLRFVDFTPVAEYLFQRSETKKAARKAMSKEEKAEEKKQKKAIEDIYGFAVVDGIKIPMDYAVEIPGLYQGHGKHPLRGKIKKRLSPSDIIINVTKKYAPECYLHGQPCQWGQIIENREVTWLAAWKHPITNELTYKGLKRVESHFVCAGDMEKFDKARKLDKNIGSIRKKYRQDLFSSQPNVQQLSTAVYLLDVLAIRPGTEKDEAKEAGTLGLTTLKCVNIKFGINNSITINFSGKSSIQFKKKFKVEKKVDENLRQFCQNKDKTSLIFPQANANSLNNYLKTLLPGLTAKVFRTWKASKILQKELDKRIPEINDATHVKQLLYNQVNIEVAKALNHKRLVSSDERIEKIKDKIKQLKKKKDSARTEKQKAGVQKSIDLQQAKLVEAEENISTSTSKTNYMDPRISVSWAKKGEVPIEKIYNKTQLRKFIWAMDVDANWRF